MSNSLGVSATSCPDTVTFRVRTSTVSGPCLITSPPGRIRRSTARILACSSARPNGLTR